MAERSASSSEDRLPWLEPVEDDAADYAVPRGRLAGGVVAALAVIAVTVGGLFWIRQPHPQAASSEVALIRAPATPYKSKPENPGGMKVSGRGDVAFAASTGDDPNATIDTSQTPEAPVRAPNATKLATATPVKPAAKPAVVAIKTAASSKPSTTTVALPAATTKPVASGPAIQLGAFSSQAKADAAWKSLSGRFASLGGLTQAIVAAPKDGGTVYRLRASGSGASAVCGKLKVAGESCVVVSN